MSPVVHTLRPLIFFSMSNIGGSSELGRIKADVEGDGDVEGNVEGVDQTAGTTIFLRSPG